MLTLLFLAWNVPALLCHGSPSFIISMCHFWSRFGWIGFCSPHTVLVVSQYNQCHVPGWWGGLLGLPVSEFNIVCWNSRFGIIHGHQIHSPIYNVNHLKSFSVGPRRILCLSSPLNWLLRFLSNISPFLRSLRLYGVKPSFPLATDSSRQLYPVHIILHKVSFSSASPTKHHL